MHDVDMVARLDFASGIVCERNKFAIAGYGEWNWWRERYEQCRQSWRLW